MQEQIRLLIKKHFELWKDVQTKDIVLERMNGITNSTYKASIANSNSPSIIFRKFGPSEQNPFLNRHQQAEIYNLVYAAQLGPNIFYYNQDFRLEQFIQSRVMAAEEMLEKGHLEESAFVFHKFHQIQPKSQSIPKISSVRKVFIQGMDKVIQQCNNKLQQFANTQQQKVMVSVVKKWICKQELNNLAIYLEQLEKEPLVFSHNDVLPYNILIQKQTSKIMTIDYEYAGYNYQIYDIAYYITQSYFNYEIKQWPYFSCQSCEKQAEEMKFIEAYVAAESMSLVQFRKKWKIQDPKFIDKLVRLRQWLPLGKMMVNLVWGYWRIMAGKSPKIPFDYWEFIKIRQKLYQRFKKGFHVRKVQVKIK